MKHVAWLAGLLLLALCARPAPAQREYQSESKGWKFTCPEGWNQIAFEIIRHREEAQRAEWPEKTFKYIAAFTRGPVNTMTYPYILVNRTDVDLTSVKYEDFEEGWALPEYVETSRDLELGTFVYSHFGQKGAVDRQRARLVAIYEDTDEHGKEFTITLFTYLGRAQSIQFECYDLKDRGTQNRGHFDEFVNSFSMREDLRFVPTEGTSRFDKSNFKEDPKPASSRSSRRYGRVGLFGFGGVGAVVALLLVWILRD